MPKKNTSFFQTGNMQRRLVDRLGYETPFKAIYPLLRNRLTSVFYHVISDEPLPYIHNLYLHRNIKTFKADLEFFTSKFNFISYDQIITHIKNGVNLPPYPIFLSFDDGHREMYDIVAPILRKKGIPATFFIISSTVDNQRMIFAHKKGLCLEKIARFTEEETIRMSNKFKSLHLSKIKDKAAFIQIVRSLRNPKEHNFLIECLIRLLEIDVKDILEKYSPYMTVSQLKSLLKQGFHLGAHSRQHIKFEYLSTEERESELCESVIFMQKNLLLSNTGFSFPNNTKNVSHEWMLSMLNKNPAIDVFFGTAGYEKNTRFLINRISLDESLQDGKEFSILDSRNLLVDKFVRSTHKK